MPEFEVTGPNGQRVIVTGADPEKAARAARAYFQQAQQPEKVSAVGGGAAAMTDGMLMGAGDEYLAGLSAVVGLQPDGEGGSRFFQYDKPLGERYDVALDAIRAEQKAFMEERPGIAIPAEIAGAVVGPGKVVKGAKTTTGAVLKAAGYGAAGGAGYAFNEAEGGAESRLNAVPVGAGAGAVFGAAGVPLAKAVGAVRNRFGGKVADMLSKSDLFRDGEFTGRGNAMLRRMGLDAEKVKKQILEDLSGRTDQAVAQSQAADDLAEFGIPAYRKDVTGSVDDAAFFDAARKSKFGDAAQRKIQDASDRQVRAVRDAGDDIARSMSPDGRTVSAHDAAEAVTTRARQIEAAQRGAAQGLYDLSEEMGMRIKPEVVNGLGARMRTALSDADISVDAGDPKSLLNTLDRWSGGDSPVTLKRLDSFRKRLVRAETTAKGEDKFAIGALKAEFDKWSGEVVEAGLFDGDPRALETLKNARGMWAQYASQFRGKDKASKFLQAMVDEEATPDQVATWLFSAGKLGTGKMNANLAKSLKDTLGADSAEWGMIRQAAFRKLFSKPDGLDQPGAQKISQDILAFLNDGSTKALANAMYTAEERALMRRYANAVKRLVPPPGAVNYSNTAHENARTMRQLWQGLSAAVGFGTGGPVGAAAGAQAAHSAGAVSNFLKTQAALKGIHPTGQGARGGAAIGAVTGGQAGPATTGLVQNLRE